MRRLLAFTALVTLIAIGASAETVLRHDESAPGEIDPAKETDYAGGVLAINIYDSLVEADAAKVVTASLAKSWTVSADGTSYTFKLEPNVKFHDGSVLSASDIVFSYERLMALKAGYSSLFEGWVKSVTAKDPTTVVFTLTKPYAPFLAALTRLQVVDKALVLNNKKDGTFGENGDYGQDYLGRLDAGSGPYSVVSHNGQELTVLKKFPGYFRPFAPNAPDTVRIKYSLDTTTVQALMSRKEHDITSQWMPPEAYRALAAAGLPLLSEDSGSVLFLKLNTQRAPTDDVNFRKAIASAFDYAALYSLLKVTATASSGKPSNGPLTSQMLGYNASIPFPKRDLAAAKKYLSQSTYKDGGPAVEFAWIAEVPFEERVALLFQQNMADIGVKVDIVKMPWTLFTEKVNKIDSTPNVSAVYSSPAVPDPDSQLYPMYHSTSGGTWLGAEWLKDAKVDELLEKGRGETDSAKRTAIYQALEARLVDLQPDIFGYVQLSLFAKQKNVTVPNLEDPKKTVAMTGGNFVFRLIEVR